MKKIIKMLNSFKRNKKETTFKRNTNAEKLLNKLNRVSTEYGKCLEKSSNRMYSDESELPYRKEIILESLKVLTTFIYFTGNKDFFGIYKTSYDSLSRFHFINASSQKKIKVFNDFDYIQERSSLMNKKSDNQNEMNEDLKMSIMRYAKEITESDKRLYDYYSELSNKEYNENEFNIFFADAKDYLIKNDLDERHFGNFNNYYEYLIEFKDPIVEMINNNI